MLLKCQSEPHPRGNWGADPTNFNCDLWELQVIRWIVGIRDDGCFQGCQWISTSCLGPCCQALWPIAWYIKSWDTNEVLRIFSGMSDLFLHNHDIFLSSLFHLWIIITLQAASKKRSRRHQTETDEFISSNSDGALDPMTLSTAYQKMKTLILAVKKEIFTDIEIHNQHVLPRWVFPYFRRSYTMQDNLLLELIYTYSYALKLLRDCWTWYVSEKGV